VARNNKFHRWLMVVISCKSYRYEDMISIVQEMVVPSDYEVMLCIIITYKVAFYFTKKYLISVASIANWSDSLSSHTNQFFFLCSHMELLLLLELLIPSSWWLYLLQAIAWRANCSERNCFILIITARMVVRYYLITFA